MNARISAFEKAALVLAILAMLIAGTSRSWAHETDQFTVPDKPLADINPEVTAQAAQYVQYAMNTLNKDMDKNPPVADDPRQQPLTLAKQIAANFGTNPFQTEFESWIKTYDFKAQPARFQVDYAQSVFDGAAVTRPLLVFALSPTININGNYIGLDKIGHFFQEGYQYYEQYSKIMSQKNAKRIDALKAAIQHGIDQENGIYGSFTIGVYSNADMAANYAGLHFYINLFQPVSLGGQIYPAILELKKGRWQYVNKTWPKDMFSRFVTDHLNESFNPPSLSKDIYGAYEANVRKLAPAWLKFYKSDEATEKERALTLSRWYGETYGYAGPDNCPTIINCYYANLEKKQDESDKSKSDKVAK